MGEHHKQARRADFTSFAVSFFAPHLFSASVRSQFGCGATALALITGIAPELISARNRRRHYSDRFMTRFLRRRKFRTVRLTPRNVTEAKAKIGPSNVILVSQLFRPDEGTWGVIYGSFYYHNFETYALSSLAFLNKPIMSAYLVVHPKWQLDEAPESAPPKPRKARPLALSSLRKNCEYTFLRPWQ